MPIIANLLRQGNPSDFAAVNRRPWLSPRLVRTWCPKGRCAATNGRR